MDVFIQCPQEIPGNTLTPFILMDFPKHFDIISIGYNNSFLCLKGSLVEIFRLRCIPIPENCFIFANSTDPDEMSPYVAFHIGLQYLFTGIQNERVNAFYQRFVSSYNILCEAMKHQKSFCFVGSE